MNSCESGSFSVQLIKVMFVVRGGSGGVALISVFARGYALPGCNRADGWAASLLALSFERLGSLRPGFLPRAGLPNRLRFVRAGGEITSLMESGSDSGHDFMALFSVQGGEGKMKIIFP